MRIFAYATVVALLLGAASCQDEPKAKCPLATDISCSAYSTLSIRVTGGSCQGTASANCEAVGTSQSKYVEAYKEWWGGESGDTSSLCDSGKAEAAAEAIATAIAEVWTSAQAQVSCEGYGTACGYSITGGTAFGLAMSEAVAQAAADASVPGVADAFCFADVRAVSSAIASAAASATAAACVEDSGSLEDWQESYVSQVAKSIATAFARATAGVCADTPEEVSAESKCDGKATSATDEEKAAYTDGEGSPGDACGGIAQIKACTGPGAAMCCDPSFTRILCRCENCNGAWVKKSVTGSLKKAFENKSKELCFCEDTADTGGEEETPAEVVEETPAEVVEETPAEVVEETPAEVVEETPAEVVEETPAEVVEETPAEVVVETPAEVVEETPTPKCTEAVDTTCAAYSTLNIKATLGSCEGQASANCEAYSSATNAFKESFNEWWKNETTLCDSGIANATAAAVGEAIATVWTDAATKVTCEGQGFACGWSAGSGTAWAVAFAEAVAQAAADATDPTGAADAFCFADVRATSAAIATAAADAQVSTCTTGGTQEDYQDSFASTVADAIATAFASATAETCNKGDEVKAASECKGVATSETEKDEFKYGAACAGSSQAKACTGAAFDKCCGTGFRNRFCPCNSYEGKCFGESGIWTRTSDRKDDGTRRTWSSSNTAESCFCDDS